MTLSFWFDFASTYSYPTAMRIEQRAQEFGVRLSWNAFLLGGAMACAAIPAPEAHVA